MNGNYHPASRDERRQSQNLQQQVLKKQRFDGEDVG